VGRWVRTDERSPVEILAVSDFLRTLFIIMIAAALIFMWGAAVVDIIQQKYSGWTVVGWLLVVLLLPIFGPILYFAVRTPREDDTERRYLAERDIQHQREARSIDSTGIAP
jgi:ABC-type transport system involved in cytochrome c biogenesis permease component